MIKISLHDYGYRGRKAYRIKEPPSCPFIAFPLHDDFASYPPLQYKLLPHPSRTSFPHLKIPQLQLFKHPIQIIRSIYLNQTLPTRLPVPAKDVLAWGRVVFIDVSVIQPYGFGGAATVLAMKVLAASAMRESSAGEDQDMDMSTTGGVLGVSGGGDACESRGRDDEAEG